MNEHERSVRWLRAKLATVLSCKYAVGLATAWGFICGTVVLVLRAEMGLPWPLLLWGLVGFPIAVGVGIVLAVRRLPAVATLRALVDQRGHCGGLLMAGDEVELGDWQREIPLAGKFKVHWEGRRSWATFAASVAFLAMAFWVPERFVGADTSNSLEIGDKVNKLAKQIQVLKEESILDQDRADSLQKKLEQLRDEAKGTDPAKTLEAFDHLKDVTKNTAKSAAESSLQKTEELAKAETLAQGLRQAMPYLDTKLVAEGMKELAGLMENLSKENESLKELSAALQASDLGKLTPEQLQALSELLRDAKGGIAEKLGRLHEAGLIDLETLRKCEKAGKCQGEALAELMKMCDGDESVKDMLAV